MTNFDVIVVGAGHAGIESALACARMNKKTLLITLNLEGIALMACNPAIGGSAKGHLVREVDALGGQMGLSADATFIQIKMLNTKKGPAVHSLRAQADKKEYQSLMKHIIENTQNLQLMQGEVQGLIEGDGKIEGVVTTLQEKYYAKAVILATGVYLKSKVIVGDYTANEGPSGLLGANFLSQSLKSLGFDILRFKTGTPARVDSRSIDFTKTIPQYGDDKIVPFSFLNKAIEREQLPCYLTYTNEKTHEVIRQNLHRSPLYSGVIEGIGPRYCPSIEDKIVRFPDKERHQLFLEPEGKNTNEYYVQGMSSSLPVDVQKALYRTIAGLENVHFTRPAYAIEYDLINPLSLKATLQTKAIENLFCAGQINGTSGYEEAAVQGVIAGINAVKYIDGKECVILTRQQAYAGVLIDDLVTKGTKEPYRMMTARAEYRLLLRQDNADTRLTEIGREAGLVCDKRYDRFMYKQQAIREQTKYLESNYIDVEKLNSFLDKNNGDTEQRGVKQVDFLQRKNATIKDIEEMDANFPKYDEDITEQTEVTLKYKGYIEKQKKQVQKAAALESKQLPQDIDYTQIKGLRLEAQGKLQEIRPQNIGQASRISGVSPADISVLLIYLTANKK